MSNQKMKGITCCGECGNYSWKKHRCMRGATDETNAANPFYDDCPLPDVSVAAYKWIPCSERMPVVETEVLITAKRKYSDGSYGYITTVAIYEDGTMLEEDSIWFWHDLDGEYDEEHDCYIIPEGWWEYKQYHKDEEYDNNIDDEVIAWMPLPEPYKGGDQNE